MCLQQRRLSTRIIYGDPYNSMPFFFILSSALGCFAVSVCVSNTTSCEGLQFFHGLASAYLHQILNSPLADGRERPSIDTQQQRNVRSEGVGMMKVRGRGKQRERDRDRERERDCSVSLVFFALHPDEASIHTTVLALCASRTVSSH